MGKFRIKKETLEFWLNKAITDGLIDYKTYAKQVGKSESYIGDIFDEIRRAFKRGDLVAPTNEVMEFFLKTSPREARLLEKTISV